MKFRTRNRKLIFLYFFKSSYIFCCLSMAYLDLTKGKCSSGQNSKNWCTDSNESLTSSEYVAKTFYIGKKEAKRSSF